MFAARDLQKIGNSLQQHCHNSTIPVVVVKSCEKFIQVRNSSPLAHLRAVEELVSSLRQCCVRCGGSTIQTRTKDIPMDSVPHFLSLPCQQNCIPRSSFAGPPNLCLVCGSQVVRRRRAQHRRQVDQAQKCGEGS